MKKEELQEAVIYECKPHWIGLVIPSIISFFFTEASIMGMTRESEDRMFFLVFLILSLSIFVIPFLSMKTNKLVLTDKRLYGRTGILKVKKLSVPVSKVQYINVDKGILGRFLGYADIKINAITGTYIFHKQSNAEEMQNAILNTIK